MAIRKQFPILKKGVFLNHAATCPISYATIEKMKAYCQEMAEPFAKHSLSLVKLIQETRQLLAELLGCQAETLALTPNTSTALSLVANSLNFKPGERVLIPRDEFPSNRYVWENLESKGIGCSFFDLPHDRPLTEVLAEQDLSNVRLISVSLVSYLTGKKIDLEAFGDFCKKRQIFSCIDGIQGVGTFSLKLESSNIDFFAGGGQKWLLGPLGCGYLYIRKELIKQLHVPLVGWTSVKDPGNFETKKLDFAEGAARFEPGLPNIISIAGLNASLNELKQIGWDFIFDRIQSHTSYLLEHLPTLISTQRDLGALVTVKQPHDSNLQHALEESQITVTIRGGLIRIAPHFYNSQEEIKQLVDILT
ncbi:aminotransferase class V-fold PLP-dependent enzyme [Simkania sp.]|uniref:aminotransferase class V-fold PLP-dependent enzyme n=1 Tax=Simkania sp. TaxID=34094 RepID=UPI003B52CAC8